MYNCVYRFIDSYGNIIYIGKANKLNNRLKGNRHRGQCHLPESAYEDIVKIEYISFKNRSGMNHAEEYFIKKLNPRYNRTHCDYEEITGNYKLDSMNWNIFWSNEDLFEKQMQNLILRYGYKHSDDLTVIRLQSDICIKDYIMFRLLHTDIHFKAFEMCEKEGANVVKSKYYDGEFYVDINDKIKNKELMHEIKNNRNLICKKILNLNDKLNKEFNKLDIRFTWLNDDIKFSEIINFMREFNLGELFIKLNVIIKDKNSDKKKNMQLWIDCI